MAVVSENERRLVWHGLLVSDMRRRYYGHMASKLGHKTRLLSALSAVLTSGAAIGFLTATGPAASVLVPAAAFLGAAASAWVALGKTPERAIKSGALHRKSSDLLTKWEILWNQIESADSKDVSRQWEQLERESAAAYEGAPEELKLDEKLWDRCQDETIIVRTAA